jgi:hypothetical protein
MEYTSISCHANGWFLFLFLFFLGDMGKSVGDDVSCSRSWGHGLRLIVCRLRAFHMISHGKSI